MLHLFIIYENLKGLCIFKLTFVHRVSVVSTNGQFIAAGDQEKNVVKLWNITNSNQYASLQVFQGIFELCFVLTLNLT